MISAADSFRECSSESCPKSVRDDCTRWRSEVENQTPSIVVDAKDEAGHDVSDVTVSIDDRVVMKKLDGRAIAVDPGTHRIAFFHDGSPTVVENAILKEGVKSRVFSVRFASTAAAAPPPEEPAVEKHHSVGPFILAGVGAAAIIVGAVVFASAPKTPKNCDANTEICTVPAGVDAQAYRGNGELATDEDQAGKHKSQRVGGGAIIGGGAIVLVAGAIWFLLEPTGNGPRRRACRSRRGSPAMEPA